MKELIAARERAKEWLNGIGEPAIEIPGEMLLVTTDGSHKLHMRMNDLIALVDGVLKQTKL